MKKSLLLFILSFLVGVINAQVSKTINVATAGSLTKLLTTTEKSTITDLTVTGNIDARDVKCMRDEITSLANLDLKLVNIIAYNGTEGTHPQTGSFNYPINEMPGFSFSKSQTSISINSTLKTIILPNNITSIGLMAFKYCEALTNLIIPSSVVWINDWALCYCTSLQTITCLSATPPTAGMSFGGGTSPTAVYVPVGSVSTYKAVLGWSQFNIVENVLKVSTQAVSSITLTSVVLNANLDFIATTPVNSYGFCWNTTGSPTISDNKTDNGAKVTTGAFSNTISNLSTGTTYYVKSFATDGERTVYGSEVTFTTASIPDDASLIMGVQTVCQGQNSVTYTIPTVAYSTSYLWTLPVGVTGTSTTNSITVNYSKTFISGNISVKGHNNWGDGAASSLSINANLLPENAGIITGNNSVCQGENSVTYSVPAILNATTYSWTLPPGVTGNSTTNILTVNFSKTATSGNITVKGHNDCGDGVSYSLPIIVNQIPIVTTTNKSVVCGGSVLLNPSITYNNIGNLKYKWTPSTGLNNDSIANPSSTVTSDITYTLTVTTPNGCIATANVKVTVMPLTVNAGSDKTVICGASTQFNSVTTNYTGTGTLKYKWTPSYGLNNDSIANPTATVTSDITYSLTVTTPNGCTATDEVKVTVTPLTANAGTDKIVVCGTSIQLNSVTTNYTGTGTLKYKWTPTTGLNNDSIANPTATVLNDITYTVTVKTPNGCISTDNVAINIIPMNKPQIGIVSINSSNKNIVVWNKPVTIGIDSYGIYRETIVSDVFEKIGTSPYSNLSVFVDNSSAPDVKSNKYKLSIIDKSGQESPLSDAHKTMHLSINKGQNNTWNLIWEPYSGFTPSTYNIYRGSSATSLGFIDATSGSSTQYSDVSAPSGDVFYQLEVISPTLVTPTQVKTSMQKITDSEVSVSVSYNSSRSNIASNVTSGINKLNDESNSINLYPNPVKDQLKIDRIGGSTFEILNIMGQIVYAGNLNISNFVQTSNFTSGVYLIKLNVGKTFEYKKFIKE